MLLGAMGLVAFFIMRRSRRHNAAARDQYSSALGHNPGAQKEAVLAVHSLPRYVSTPTFDTEYGPPGQRASELPERRN